jgi:nitrous oxide reductase accessory protein NosL
MKLARTLLAVLTVSVLAACADSVTAPQAQPESQPAADGLTCEGTLVREVSPDGAIVYRCTGQMGSGG